MIIYIYYDKINTRACNVYTTTAKTAKKLVSAYAPEPDTKTSFAPKRLYKLLGPKDNRNKPADPIWVASTAKGGNTQ
jgi:hypothetical protein